MTKWGELCEEQRLDHHRHDAWRGDQRADIDIIELLQLHAVDGDDFPWPVELAVHEPAKSLADVAVDHQQQELDLVPERRERVDDPLPCGLQARMLRIAVPGERNRQAPIAVELDFFEARTDGVGEPDRIDIAPP